MLAPAIRTHFPTSMPTDWEKAMSDPLNQSLSFDMACPACSELTRQTLAWYVARDEMDCAHCAILISLKGTETGARLEKLNQLCLQLDTTTTQGLD